MTQRLVLLHRPSHGWQSHKKKEECHDRRKINRQEKFACILLMSNPHARSLLMEGRKTTKKKQVATAREAKTSTWAPNFLSRRLFGGKNPNKPLPQACTGSGRPPARRHEGICPRTRVEATGVASHPRPPAAPGGSPGAPDSRRPSREEEGGGIRGWDGGGREPNRPAPAWMGSPCSWRRRWSRSRRSSRGWPSRWRW